DRRRPERRAEAPRQDEQERGVGGVQQDVDQVEAHGAPAEEAPAERQAHDDERAVIPGPGGGAVPEMMPEGADRAPGLAEKAVVDDQMVVVVDKSERDRPQMKGRRQARWAQAGGEAESLRLHRRGESHLQ